LAATIGGSVVGVAGVAASVWSNWLQHVSARELSARQQEHERELARGARLFERRAPVYEETLKLLYIATRRVDETERIIRFAGDPEPPEPPSEEEWREAQVRLRTFGSSNVADAFDAYAAAVTAFFERAREVQWHREHGEDADAAVAAHKALEEARANVHEALRTLERLVSDELAAL
jgi:hypothetical protein